MLITFFVLLPHKLNQTITTLKGGIWGTLNLSPQAMACDTWAQHKLSHILGDGSSILTLTLLFTFCSKCIIKDMAILLTAYIHGFACILL